MVANSHFHTRTEKNLLGTEKQEKKKKKKGFVHAEIHSF